MKAVYLNQKAGPEALLTGDIPAPVPAPGELLIKVHATGIMRTELEWFPTFFQKSGEPRPFPIVLSHEFSGVVAALGPGVQNVKVGDAVYGLNDWFINGAQAEFCTVGASAVAPKPKSLDHVQSGVVPISALTAWQGLFQHGQLQAGERVLIHGGAGGVGTFAIQFARARGAHVIATASGGNVDFVRSLGANEVVDYHKAKFEDTARDVDLVFDVVGGETLQRSFGVLKKGGRAVTAATGAGDSSDLRIRAAFMFVEAHGSQLAEIAAQIDAGKIRVFVADVFPLEKAREAYARSEQGKMRGKVALRVVDQ